MVISTTYSFGACSPSWVMRYGDPASARYVVAELLASYDNLTSDEITTTEAMRRLRLLRAARREISHG